MTWTIVAVAGGGVPNYDIALDGQRFLMVKRDAETPENDTEPEIILVQN